ncbi:HD family phosphohydrolase [Paenibacillus selenitireducens]|uniref:HD family phosphohydrolase n=1 Tax=Paenibacillus selenitireducens TaxID=1324314 RepID=A0A1T2X2W5_9BACL|nr:diguanylate cyclase [Paenibacillus selenitireducens]OPA74056.1 HD family phosphohydrolase [Paenibacillus selenitireducens]
MLDKTILQLRQYKHIFELFFTLTGLVLGVIYSLYHYRPIFISDWIIIYSMVVAVVLLDVYMFKIPPEGNSESMDSSVYLAAVFMYGGSFTLIIMMISFLFMIIRGITIKTTSIIKHGVNAALYTFMIVGADVTYKWTGGMTGSFQFNNLYPYLGAIIVYSIINILLISVLTVIYEGGSVKETLLIYSRNSLFAYLSTMLLSLVVLILTDNSGIFGLMLFLSIAMFLSVAFKKLFVIYNQISDKANIDQRTGLYSHSYFEEKLDDYIKLYRDRDQVFSLAMLDLDDFKKYNDAYGHPQGDRLLSFFGDIIKKECEAAKFLPARYGGEEFSIIMPGVTKEKANEFINELRKKVNNSLFDGVDVFPHGCISFSAGILEITKDNYDKSQLVDHADRALYIAKSKGKNTVSIYGEQSYLPQRFEHDIHEIEQQVKIFLSKDVYTYKHSKRVYSYAVEMAEVLQLKEEDRRTLILGALIHDIGKLEIPRDVLNKKTRLTPDEWEMVKKHVLWGKEIVLASGKYKELIPLVELHHERYDGKGYPYGLQGEEIPRLARLLCIIDSFDAMTTERPYQATKSFHEALGEIRLCSGSQFDPELAVQFIQFMEHKIASQLLTAK